MTSNNNKKMETLKEEYTNIKMNEEQKKELMKTMERAKMDKRRKTTNSTSWITKTAMEYCKYTKRQYGCQWL